MRTSLPDEREQQLVRRFFDDARSGFFVEVGANRAGAIADVASRAAWLERSAYRAAPDLAEELSRLRRAKVFAVAWPVGSLVEPWDHAGRVQNRETAATCGLVQNPLPCLPCEKLGCEGHLDSFSRCMDELPRRANTALARA